MSRPPFGSLLFPLSSPIRSVGGTYRLCLHHHPPFNLGNPRHHLRPGTLRLQTRLTSRLETSNRHQGKIRSTTSRRTTLISPLKRNPSTFIISRFLPSLEPIPPSESNIPRFESSSIPSTRANKVERAVCCLGAVVFRHHSRALRKLSPFNIFPHAFIALRFPFFIQPPLHHHFRALIHPTLYATYLVILRRYGFPPPWRFPRRR